MCLAGLWHSRPSPSLNPAMWRFKLEAATRFPSILASGSLIPIVVYRDGDGYSWLNTCKAGIHERNGVSGFPLPALYMFSRPLVFATIPKLRLRLPPVLHQFLWVAASSRLLYIGMGMVIPWLNTYPAKAGIQERNGYCGFPLPAFAGTSLHLQRQVRE
jgi:hypothetical protein